MPGSNIISRTTYSHYGGEHWFNTLISRQKICTEILTTVKPTEEQLKSLAKCLYKTTEELIEGWHIMQKEIERLENKIKSLKPDCGQYRIRTYDLCDVNTAL